MSKKTPVQTIKELVQYLPEKDIKFANKFIDKRDFESLSDLVKSDIYKIERDINSIPEELEDEKIVKQKVLNQLENLKSEVDSYLMLLGYTEDELYNNDDYEYI